MLLPMHVSQAESGKGGLIGPNCSLVDMLLKYAHEADKALSSWALILSQFPICRLDHKCNPPCNQSFCNIVISLDRNEQSSPVLSNCFGLFLVTFQSSNRTR